MYVLLFHSIFSLIFCSISLCSFCAIFPHLFFIIHFGPFCIILSHFSEEARLSCFDQAWKEVLGAEKALEVASALETAGVSHVSDLPNSACQLNGLMLTANQSYRVYTRTQEILAVQNPKAAAVPILAFTLESFEEARAWLDDQKKSSAILTEEDKKYFRHRASGRGKTPVLQSDLDDENSVMCNKKINGVWVSKKRIEFDKQFLQLYKPSYYPSTNSAHSQLLGEKEEIEIQLSAKAGAQKMMKYNVPIGNLAKWTTKRCPLAVIEHLQSQFRFQVCSFKHFGSLWVVLGDTLHFEPFWSIFLHGLFFFLVFCSLFLVFFVCQ